MTESNSVLGSLAKSGIAVLVATIFGRALGLVAEIMIVRTLEPSTYGSLALAYTIVFSLGSIALFGVHDGITRKISAVDTADRMGAIISSGYTIVLITSLPIFSIVFIFRESINNLLTPDGLAYYLLLLLPYILIHPLATIAYSSLRGQKETLRAVFSKMISARILAVGLLVGVVLLGFELYAAILYWMGYPLLTFFIASVIIYRNPSIQGYNFEFPDIKLTRELFYFSWPIAISSVLFMLFANLDIFMIGYFLASDKVGYYRAIQPLKQAATFALGSFTFLFLPIATEYYERDDTDGLNEIFTVTTKWILVITLPAILLFTLFPDPVITVFFGETYLPAAPVLTILVGGLLVRAVTGLDGDVVKAINRPKIELYSGVIGFISNLSLNIVLIPRIGIIGAAVATITGYLVYNVAEVIWIYRITGVTPFSRNILKHTTAMITLGIAIDSIAPSEFGILGLIVLGIAFTAVQPLVLVGTNSVASNDIYLIQQIEDRIGRDLSPIKNFASKGIKT